MMKITTLRGDLTDNSVKRKAPEPISFVVQANTSIRSPRKFVVPIIYNYIIYNLLDQTIAQTLDLICKTKSLLNSASVFKFDFFFVGIL